MQNIFTKQYIFISNAVILSMHLQSQKTNNQRRDSFLQLKTFGHNAFTQVLHKMTKQTVFFKKYAFKSVTFDIKKSEWNIGKRAC